MAVIVFSAKRHRSIVAELGKHRRNVAGALSKKGGFTRRTRQVSHRVCCFFANLTAPIDHRDRAKKVQREMPFAAQIIRSSRRRIFRLLTYRPTADLLMTMHDHVRRPMRC